MLNALLQAAGKGAPSAMAALDKKTVERMVLSSLEQTLLARLGATLTPVTDAFRAKRPAVKAKMATAASRRRRPGGADRVGGATGGLQGGSGPARHVQLQSLMGSSKNTSIRADQFNPMVKQFNDKLTTTLTRSSPPRSSSGRDRTHPLAVAGPDVGRRGAGRVRRRDGVARGAHPPGRLPTIGTWTTTVSAEDLTALDGQRRDVDLRHPVSEPVVVLADRVAAAARQTPGRTVRSLSPGRPSREPGQSPSSWPAT